MSLKCPYCDSYISNNFAKCPYCGRWVPHHLRRAHAREANLPYIGVIPDDRTRANLRAHARFEKIGFFFFILPALLFLVVAVLDAPFLLNGLIIKTMQMHPKETFIIFVVLAILGYTLFMISQLPYARAQLEHY